MKVERSIEIETTDIQIGDRINVDGDHYTATCQEITQSGALFLLDQYLDEPMHMNRKNTYNGGYKKSELRKALKSEEVLNIFKDILGYMVPFDNGDLLRIPFAGELFGDNLPEWCESDGCKQWPLMKNEKNRVALYKRNHEGGGLQNNYEFGWFRKNYEWGWLQNKDKILSNCCAYVNDKGVVAGAYPSSIIGVRLVFMIKKTNNTD